MRGEFGIFDFWALEVMCASGANVSKVLMAVQHCSALSTLAQSPGSLRWMRYVA
jgi:hypothetical protein